MRELRLRIKLCNNSNQKRLKSLRSFRFKLSSLKKRIQFIKRIYNRLPKKLIRLLLLVLKRRKRRQR